MIVLVSVCLIQMVTGRVMNLKFLDAQIFSTNYNPNATEDDESCLFVNTGVTHGITISSALG